MISERWDGSGCGWYWKEIAYCVEKRDRMKYTQAIDE
jgi:hypothetical protein